MPPKKRSIAKEELQRIIELCRSIEERGLNPFLVDVDELVTILREYFPDLDKPEELCLDAEALNSIASVIRLQGEWVRRRSSSLYRDPFLIEEKIRSLSRERLAEVFLKIWRPIIEFEQITIPSLRQALKYWGTLPPLDERWLRGGLFIREPGTTTEEDLIKQRILAEKAFSEELNSLWMELKRRTRGGKIRYWDFIGAETYQETIRRAYLTSFLLTYGYATLEVNPLEGEMTIRPLDEPTPVGEREQAISMPIPITPEEWMRWLREREA